MSAWEPHPNQPNQHQTPNVGRWSWFSTLWLLTTHSNHHHFLTQTTYLETIALPPPILNGRIRRPDFHYHSATAA
jgi:hypothetical protein